MSWHQFIHSDPDVLLGKPVVKGTRISVDFISNLFATGWTKEQVLENYPNISADSLKAVFAFAAECMSEESFFIVPTKVA